MKSKTKRRLKVYLPIAIAVILSAVIIAIFLFANKVKAKDYFNALNNSGYTKQVQTTQITENDMLVYEKVETILFEGENVYHKIEEKQLSSQIGVDYETSTLEFYYSKNKMYYFENNVWKEDSFVLSQRLKLYYLHTDYFSSLKFDKKIDTFGTLQGGIKDNCVKNVVDGALKDMTLNIIIDKNLKVQNFNIIAKTQSNRNVEIKNVYTYNYESVQLPV